MSHGTGAHGMMLLHSHEIIQEVMLIMLIHGHRLSKVKECSKMSHVKAGFRPLDL